MKYSIIIPHKDSVKSLQRLLSTIPDSGDFEVLVIDDNSNSSTVNDLKAIELNKNVSIEYSHVSKGAGAARNLGLEKASGKWILFADSDDIFSNNMRVLLDKHYSSSSDIVYFKTDSFYEDSGLQAQRHKRYAELVEGYLKDKSCSDELKYYFTPPWGKMIKRKIIFENDIKFQETIASNDILFSLRTAHFSKSISADSSKLYIISMNTGSLINSISKKHFNDRLNVAIDANNFLRSINKNKYQLSVLYYLFRSYKFGGSYMVKVIAKLIRNRSNLLIGLNKLLRFKSILNERENKQYLKEL